MNYYQFMDKADAWAENDGMAIWLGQHCLIIIIGLILIAAFLAWVIMMGEN